MTYTSAETVSGLMEVRSREGRICVAVRSADVPRRKTVRNIPEVMIHLMRVRKPSIITA